MADTILNEAALALRQEWGLQLPETLSEEALLQLLADRIVSILEKGAETFYQLMYRLDISEKKLNIITGQDNIPAGIARLVYERQLEKIRSRREHQMKQEDTDPELQW
jgi:hypothetical protein